MSGNRRALEDDLEWFRQLDVGSALISDIAPDLKRPRPKKKPAFQFGFAAPPAPPKRRRGK